MNDKRIDDSSLILLPDRYAICLLPPDQPLEDWMHKGAFHSVTRTADETSVICAESALPIDITAELGWRIIKIDAVLGFVETGIIAKMSGVLSRAGVSIFAISTFNTDYVLLKDASIDDARDALEKAGYRITDENELREVA